MALKLLQPGIQPLGQFDGLDSEVLTLKGGEVVTLTAVTTSGQPGVSGSGNDQGAFDVFDGYVNVSGTFKRPAVTKTFAANPTVGPRPLMLSDDGIAGYGTLFGAVVGGTVGQQTNNPSTYTYTGALLGPHTSTGSGKTTCWDKPGLYAVSLDAVDTNASTGLQPTNTGLTISTPLGFTTAGLLTPNSGAMVQQNAVNTIVAHLVEFNTNGALVNTPNYLVAALNSPSGNVSSVQPRAFQFATIYFSPPTS